METNDVRYGKSQWEEYKLTENMTEEQNRGDGSYGFLSIELTKCYLTERQLHIILASLCIRKLTIQLKVAFIKTSF